MIVGKTILSTKPSDTWKLRNEDVAFDGHRCLLKVKECTRVEICGFRGERYLRTGRSQWTIRDIEEAFSKFTPK